MRKKKIGIKTKKKKNKKQKKEREEQDHQVQVPACARQHANEVARLKNIVYFRTTDITVNARSACCEWVFRNAKNQ